MNFQIEILAVNPTTKPTAKGSYTQLDVAFKKDGKTEGKKIMPFGASKAAYETLKNAKFGETYTITSVKNEQSGYWDWTDASVGGAGNTISAGGAKPTLSPKSTYETPEERAKKQVYIVRQSSISAAVALLHNDKKPADANEVIATAKLFEAYVFGNDSPIPDITEMEDDVPM